MSLSARGRAALAYAELLGWRVLPTWGLVAGACACGKPDCYSPGKHPVGSLVPHGCLHATTDAATIRAWWTRYPDAHVAIAPDDYFVVDVDGPAGTAALEALLDAHGPLPDTPTAQTGGGGRHILFKQVDPPIRNKVKHEGLDVRARGGYFLVAPSGHVSGRSYLWEFGAGPRDVPIADPPAWLVDLFRGEQRDLRPLPTDPHGAVPTRYARAALAGELERVLTLPPGGGRRRELNTSAFRLARFVRQNVLAEADVERALLEACGGNGAGNEFGPQELLPIIRRGLAAGLREAR